MHSGNGSLNKVLFIDEDDYKTDDQARLENLVLTSRLFKRSYVHSGSGQLGPALTNRFCTIYNYYSSLNNYALERQSLTAHACTTLLCTNASCATWPLTAWSE